MDWLDAKGIEVDYLTDHDLHAEGQDLLSRYRVVISSSHHEYWTEPMLDALEAYLDAGGRFMYLSGNGLYGVASIDPARPHVLEVRRWGTSWPFEVHPAERCHSTTGEPGGTWRNRGRPPNRLVGVGTAGAEFGPGVPFQRMAASRDPRADLAYLEYPNGGAVFSAGAICWRGALSCNGYDNNVSRITENVLRNFAA